MRDMRSTSPRPRRRNAPQHLSLEALETRRLLSQIVWENRGDDNFDLL